MIIMKEIKQEILKLDFYTKTLINNGTYKLFELHDVLNKPSFALQKSENCFILLDQDGYPIKEEKEINYPNKEQIVFKYIEPSTKYSFNSLV